MKYFLLKDDKGNKIQLFKELFHICELNLVDFMHSNDTIFLDGKPAL